MCQYVSICGQYHSNNQPNNYIIIFNIQMNSTDEPKQTVRKEFWRKCRKSSHCLDAQDAFLKTLTVKYLFDITKIPNRKFAKGERRNTWVATSYYDGGQHLGLGVFVNGKVCKDEFLLIYRGDTKIFRPHSKDKQNKQHRPRMGSVFQSSPYVLEFTDDDGVRYVVNGKGADTEHGSIGHLVNSVPLGTSEDLQPCRFEWNPKFKAFVLKANYAWDSGQDYVELRVSYCKNDQALEFWSENTTFQYLSNKDKQVVLEHVKIPIEPMVTRQDYAKKRKIVCQHAANCKKAKQKLRKIKRSLNLRNLKGYKEVV
jgi:hypothetical protein